MHEDILKETACLLTLLVVDQDSASRDSFGKYLSLYCKNVVYASHVEEALELYRKQAFHIVFTDIDVTDINGQHFIAEMVKMNASQTVVACSKRTNDPNLLLQLLDMGISGFIDKLSQWEDAGKMLSKLAQQTHDRCMLMHYVTELEKINHEVVGHKGFTEDLAEKVVKTGEAVTASADAEADDFDFFIAPANTSTPKADDSIYKDYFDFLDLDDRDELRDQIGEIDAALFNAFTDGNSSHLQIEKLGASLMRYGNVLLHYQFFSDMGTVMLEFSQKISDKSELIVAQARDFELLLSGFCTGLQTFMTEVWEKISDDPKYFNDSIINDAKLIIGLISPDECADNEEELVFF